MLTLLLLAAAPVSLPVQTQKVVIFDHRCAPKSSSPAVAEVKSVSSSHVVIFARSVGSTKVRFPCTRERIDVTVTKFEPDAVVTESKKLFATLPVTAVWWNNVGIQVHCPRCTVEQWQRVEAIQAMYPATQTPGPKRVPAAELVPIVAAELKDFDSLTLDVSRDGFVVLHGEVKDEATRVEVLERVRRFPSLGVDVTVKK